jgi:hypothetical protein
MFLVPNIDQMYKEMKKIVEVGNKHGNRDEFPNLADLFLAHLKGQVSYSRSQSCFVNQHKNFLLFHFHIAARHCNDL